MKTALWICTKNTRELSIDFQNLSHNEIINLRSQARQTSARAPSFRYTLPNTSNIRLQLRLTPSRLQVFSIRSSKCATFLGFDAYTLLFSKPHRKMSQLCFNQGLVNFLPDSDLTFHFQSQRSPILTRRRLYQQIPNKN